MRNLGHYHELGRLELMLPLSVDQRKDQLLNQVDRRYRPVRKEKMLNASEQTPGPQI